MPLRAKLQRARATVIPDPIVNGVTRQTPGVIAVDGFTQGLARWIVDNGQWSVAGGMLVAQNPDNFGGSTPPGHGRLIYASALALNSVCLQLDVFGNIAGGFSSWVGLGIRNTGIGPDREVAFENDVGGVLGTQSVRCVIGDVQGNAFVVLGNNAHPELVWIATKLEVIFALNRIRAWADHPDSVTSMALLCDNTGSNPPSQFQAEIILKNDANDKPGSAVARRFVLMRKNDIDVTGVVGGSLIVNIAGGADTPIALNSLGRGHLTMGGIKFPVSIRYRFFDAVAALIADLTISNSYGGDTVGVSALPAFDPLNFNIARQSTGLLFSDDFNRADGAIGANYVVNAGTWTISGNKLKAVAVNNQSHQLRIATAALALRKDYHTQVSVSRSSLLSFGQLMNRLTTDFLNYFLVTIGASDAGGGWADSLVQYRTLAGAPQDFNVGANAAPVAGVAQRHTFTTIGNSQQSWIGAAPTLVNAHATPNGDGSVGLQVFGQPAGPATSDVFFEDLFVCSSRTITVTNIPDGWKLRVTGVGDSAPASDGIATIDCGPNAMPFADVRIVDASGAEVKTLAPAGGVFCGDVYALT